MLRIRKFFNAEFGLKKDGCLNKAHFIVAACFLSSVLYSKSKKQK